MSQVQTKLPGDIWVNATWDEYLHTSNDSVYEKAKFYYYNERTRLEIPPFGNVHFRDRSANSTQCFIPFWVGCPVAVNVLISLLCCGP